MSIAYTTKKNKRLIGNELTITNESHLIGVSGVFTITPNKIRLLEVPLLEDPSTVTISGFTEVDALPGPFEFVVDYNIGRITFNALRNGEFVAVSYKGRGSEVDSEDVNELQIPVSAIIDSDGITTTLTAGIVHPNNISVDVGDNFVFPNDVTADNDIFATNTLNQGGTTLTINTTETGSPTLNAQFVVSRGSSTPVSLRWNETLDAWEFVDNITAIFQFYNSGAFGLTGPIHIADGTAAAPAYSFTSATNLGIFKPATDTLAISTAGVEQWRVGSGGNWTSQNGGRVRTGDGDALLPGFTFTTDTDLGIFRIAEDDLGFTTNGVQRLHINTAAASFVLPITVTTAASGTSATFTDATNSTLRIKHPASNVVNLDVDSSNYFKFSVAGTEIARLKTGQALFSDGTFLLPSISFLSDPTTGISLPFTGPSIIGFSIAGSEIARFTSTGDFQIQETERIIFDGIGNTFLKFTTADGFIGQSAVDTSFALKSANYFSLESNHFSTGKAFGLITILNYSALSGKTVTVDGITVTEGVHWFAATNNDTTASSLATAILSNVLTVSAASVDNVVNIVANASGTGGNSITLATNSSSILLSGSTLKAGGAAQTSRPSIAMNLDGSINILNDSQGDITARSLFVRIAGGLSSGKHRTAQIMPDGLGLGTAASGTIVVFNYAVLSGAVVTVNGTTVTEPTDWQALTSNNATATSLASAINALAGVGASAIGNIITVTADLAGKEGNDISLMSSDNTNLITSEFLHGGADDFALAFGYTANGSAVTAANIDSHNSLPIVFTINDTEVARIAPTSVSVQQQIDMNSHKVVNVTDPTAAQDAATKAYVDSVAAGLDPKASVRVATTANITLSGNQTLDGVLTITGDRVLVKNQTTATQNGIYIAASGAWARSTDMDGTPTSEVSGGNFTFVEQGTTLSGTGWVIVWNGIVNVGTDPINWTQFSQPASLVTVVSSDPGSPVTGQIWFNTTDGQFKGYNGVSVVILG